MLALARVSKVLGGHTVIDDVSLEVPAGSTTVLLGPSGCGKSTLLRLFLGLLFPDHGDITFDGESVTRDRVREIRLRSGYVIQDGGLFPHMTARANASIMARELRWPANRIDARLADLADLTHLHRRFLDRYPHQLSGGQRQRIALMRALMLDPDVLFMDEPLGALDPMVRRDLQEELQSIFAALRKTVVLVTHDLGEAAHFAGTIVLMRKGAVVQQGSPADLIEAPAAPFVTEFVTAQRDQAFHEPRPASPRE